MVFHLLFARRSIIRLSLSADADYGCFDYNCPGRFLSEPKTSFYLLYYRHKFSEAKRMPKNYVGLKIEKATEGTKMGQEEFQTGRKSFRVRVIR